MPLLPVDEQSILGTEPVNAERPVLLRQKRAQSVTRSRSQLRSLDGASLSETLPVPIHTATTPASHRLGGPAPGRCCHLDADETPRTSALLAHPFACRAHPAQTRVTAANAAQL